VGGPRAPTTLDTRNGNGVPCVTANLGGYRVSPLAQAFIDKNHRKPGVDVLIVTPELLRGYVDRGVMTFDGTTYRLAGEKEGDNE
jgi:hypothetical protein